MVDAAPSRTEHQVSPCRQVLTSFSYTNTHCCLDSRFFPLLFWYSFFLSSSPFFSSSAEGGGGIGCGYLGFLDGFTPLQSPFPFVQIQRRFPFCPSGSTTWLMYLKVVSIAQLMTQKFVSKTFVCYSPENLPLLHFFYILLRFYRLLVFRRTG